MPRQPAVMLAGLVALEAGVAAIMLNEAITASTPAELSRFLIHWQMPELQGTAVHDG